MQTGHVARTVMQAKKQHDTTGEEREIREVGQRRAHHTAQRVAPDGSLKMSSQSTAANAPYPKPDLSVGTCRKEGLGAVGENFRSSQEASSEWKFSLK